MTKIPIGRLIRKIARHEIAATSQPPSSGPIAAATPPSPDQAPIARARSVGPEARLDHRQAPRRQHRSADSLQHPGDDQQLDVGSDRAQQRGAGEHGRSEHEDPPAPVAVAERSAEQDQRGERQQIPVEDPLQRAGLGLEVAADVGERDVDDRSVEKRETGAQDGDREHPAAGAALERHPLAIQWRLGFQRPR